MAERLELSVPVLMGEGCVDEVGRCLQPMSVRRALIVTDPGVLAAGHAHRVIDALAAVGLETTVFDAVHENPTTLDVASCVEVARAFDPDVLVAVGGGSSMDAAKGCNFIFTNGGDMKDYWGVDKAVRPMLPFVAIPTTGGTGSECQRFALISDPETHRKMACGDGKTLAWLAVLDPSLTVTQPPFVTACTGMDALSHAVEAAVTKPATAQSVSWATDSFVRIVHALPTVMAEPGNLAARGDMQLGAALAGAAIEHSMLGAAHSAANPLTAQFDVVHGQAVGIMLPVIVAYNGHDPAVADRYRDLLVAADLAGPDMDAGTAVARLADVLRERLRQTGLAAGLSSLGVGPENLARLSADAADQWTASFNPRPVTADDFEAFYRALLT